MGRDKQLSAEWQVADTAVDLHQLPEWIDEEKARQARAALRTPEIAELLASSREPMSRERFLANIRYSIGPGRSLMLDDDPTHYLSPTTLGQLRRGADMGLKTNGNQIAW